MQFPKTHPPHVVRAIWTVGAFIAGLVVLAIVTFGIGLYVVGWHDQATQKVVRVFPVPAVKVGWQVASTRDYFAQLNALRQYQTAQNKRAPNTVVAQSEKDLRRTALRKLLRDTALTQLLKEHDLSLTDGDIDQAFSSQISQVGNRKVTLNAIRELYGWGEEEYQAYVIRSAVGREKLRDYLSFTKPYNQPAEKQAQAVLAEIQAGTDSFETIAKKYSDDVYGASGGDVGYVRRGQQADEIEDIAFGLEPGKTSDIVHTKYGYHILKVTERRETDGQLEVHLFQIFIAGPSVDDFISDYLKKSSVSVWIPGYRWDKKTGDVVAK